MSAWQEIHLCEIAEVIMGQSPNGEHYNMTQDGKPLITGAGQFGKRYPEPTQFSKTGAKTSKPGDIIICIRATIGDLNWSDREYFLGRGVAAIRPGNRVEAGYLWHVLKTLKTNLESQATGSTFKQIKRDDLASVVVKLPSLFEQRRIAEILDRAEDLRTKRRAALAQIDTLTQAIFFEMFGDPTTNQKNWPITTLGELIEEGPQNGLYKPSSDYGTGTPILRIDAFYDGEVIDIGALKRVLLSKHEQELFSLHSDDIVINRVNSMEYLGKCALIPELQEPTVFESNMMRFRVDHKRLHTHFLIKFLQTSFIKAQIQQRAKHAVNQSSINQKDVCGFLLNLPPINLQREFAKRILAVENFKIAYRTSATGMDALFASLQHRAFRGEL